MSYATFGRIQPIVPGFVRILIRLARILGRSAEFAKKWPVHFQISNGLKNCEDSSDFDDSWTKSIETTQTFSEIFATAKKLLRPQKNTATNEPTKEQTKKVFCGDPRKRKRIDGSKRNTAIWRCSFCFLA